MCIGRNYRIELEKRLHEINILRESNLSSKIKPAVLINSEKLKLKDESDINTKNNSKSSGFVTLGVNLATNISFIINFIFFNLPTFSVYRICCLENITMIN